MSKYVNRKAVEEALFTKWEKERQHLIEYLKQYRATKEYSSKEQAVDNWLRGYGEAVGDFLAIMEKTPAAEVVPVATDTNVGGSRWQSVAVGGSRWQMDSRHGEVARRKQTGSLLLSREGLWKQMCC